MGFLETAKNEFFSMSIWMLQIFVPILIVTGLWGGFATLAAARIVNKKIHTEGFRAMILGFACFGATAGMISGVCRDSIVGLFLTGLLSVFSAMLSYLFTKESLKEWRPYVPYALVALSFSAISGLSCGGYHKAQWEQFDRDYEKAMLEYKQVTLPVQREWLEKVNGLTPSKQEEGAETKAKASGGEKDKGQNAAGAEVPKFPERPERGHLF